MDQKNRRTMYLSFKMATVRQVTFFHSIWHRLDQRHAEFK